MTLDWKSRRVYPTQLGGTQTSSRLADQPNQVIGLRNVSNTTPAWTHPHQSDANNDRNSSIMVTKRPTMRSDITRESFLHRLLDIERRHDEKRLARQNGGTRTAPGMQDAEDALMDNQIPSVQEMTSSPVYPRSPTRWLSEQIFDDTIEGEGISHHNRSSWYKTAYCRLPTLSDVHRMSSNSMSSSAEATSSVLLHQKDADNSLISSSNISVVAIDQHSDDLQKRSVVRKRPLRLPPIFLPPIYTVRPRPLKERDFLTPTHIRGPITDDEWEDLGQCRYIRPALPRFQIPLASSQMSSL